MDDELKKNVLKTGTSILGIICKDGIVMAADRQSSLGGETAVMVSNKNKQKIYEINYYTLVSAAGMVSEIQVMLKLIKAELKLKELKSKTKPSVKDEANLFATLAYHKIRQLSPLLSIAGFIVGGYDTEPHLFHISPDGSVSEESDYIADGSGIMFLYGILERGYRKDMTVKEGVQLAVECIKASTQRDPASGFGIDVFSITKDGIRHEVEEKIEPKYVAEEKK